MNLKSLLPVLFVLASVVQSAGQSYNPNIDFELGNTSVWHYFTGSCCPIVTSTATAPLAGRHEITSGSALDPYGGFPIVSPFGGSYSLKLGNNSVGAEAEKARYYIHVPTGVTDYSVIYRFAVVFQDPGHAPSQQPRFEVHAYDSVTNNPISCAQFVYVADSTLPGFHRSTVDTTVYYKEWANGNINLSGWAGATVIIDFATADCGLGAHFGYGYVDMSSGIGAGLSSVCDTDSITMNAPGGFMTYSWYDSLTGALVDTGMVFTMANPASTKTIKLVMLPYPGYGCPDTIFRRIMPSHLVVRGGIDTVVCPGIPVLLTVHATDSAMPLTYAWFPSAGLSCPSCSSTVVTPLVHTRYTVIVTNSMGCAKTDTFDVTPDMMLVNGSDKMLCEGASATLTALATSLSMPLTYSWSPAAGLSCTACATTVADPPGTTDYIVTVTDMMGCVMKDTIRVGRDDLHVTPASDMLACEGVAVPLAAVVTGSAVPFTYNWSPGVGLTCVNCSNPVANPGASKDYYVVVTDTLGCRVRDTVKVNVNYVILDPIADIGICVGSSKIIYPSVLANAAPLNYVWAPATGLSCATCANPVVEASATTTYTLTVTDSSGCAQQTTATVFVDNISMDPLADTAICLGFPVQIAAHAATNGGALSFLWTPSIGLSCDNCAEPYATTHETTTYTVIVSDGSGCSVTDTLRIRIDPCDIFFPNAFTPNNDGKNDIIRVVGHLDYYTNFSMSLYNRWGQRVYYTEDIYAGWDGRYKEVDAELGTYFYMILYTLYGKSSMMKGDFELIR